MYEINGRAFEPAELKSMRKASAAVIERMASERLGEDDAAKAVLLVVLTGYGRDPQRSLNADDLAEAAIARVRATNR